MANDLIVGEWRNGLDDGPRSVVLEVIKRRTSGFRLGPYDNTTAVLVDLLDAYDEWAESIIEDESCDCVEEGEPPALRPPRHLRKLARESE